MSDTAQRASFLCNKRATLRNKRATGQLKDSSDIEGMGRPHACSNP
jgi:hypothetical protein